MIFLIAYMLQKAFSKLILFELDNILIKNQHFDINIWIVRNVNHCYIFLEKLYSI